MADPWMGLTLEEVQRKAGCLERENKALLARLKALEAVAADILMADGHRPTYDWFDTLHAALASKPPAGPPEPSREGGGPSGDPAPAPAASGSPVVAGAAERLQGAPRFPTTDEEIDAFCESCEPTEEEKRIHERAWKRIEARLEADRLLTEARRRTVAMWWIARWYRVQWLQAGERIRLLEAALDTRRP